jgi:hypothetical protein
MGHGPTCSSLTSDEPEHSSYRTHRLGPLVIACSMHLQRRSHDRSFL